MLQSIISLTGTSIAYYM